jgi:hypothetical protein
MTLNSPRRIVRCLTVLTGVVILMFSGGCATKRFVPRILSEAVTVRDNGGRPVSTETASVAPRAVRPRAKSASAASKKAAASRSTVPSSAAVGTMGEGHSSPVVLLETASAVVQSAPAAAPASKPGESRPFAARLASMADGGVVVLAALATMFISGVLYRRRA